MLRPASSPRRFSGEARVLESLKKALVSLVGGASWTPEELGKTLDSMVAQGHLTEDQAARLRRALLAEEPGRDREEEAAERMGKEVARLLERLPVVGRREFRRLEERVRLLEEKLGLASPQCQAPDELRQAPDEVPPVAGRGGGLDGSPPPG